ncbi:hypothetical protein A5699_01525 [Mycobacterium sp. E802]|uniref:hypothetical protein n=1 Tax=Mycobacterium sp. E802 TaxID=1834152 RepID=UPI0007FEDBC0|nr:hypothetical protein [Mycobacterium sp. E802]OBG87449.1 hypothetical protein A5699_01525 [Mycobacterium sp. E802]
MSDVETGQVPTESTETDEKASASAPGADDGTGGSETQSDTFTREYVEGLRKENADHRTKAKAAEERADKLARRLHAALVAANGTLVDPDALPFDPKHLEDDEKLSAAIENLTTAKPYLKARKATGDAGQGPRGDGRAALSWADLFTK